jgi:glycosyltransferase involved in cell wall biosynthesis
MDSLKVRTLSTVFPNPNEPDLGLFVRARLNELAREADVNVVAPVPLVDYGNPKGRYFAAQRIPSRRRDGALEIYHPRWFHLPGGTFLNSFFLAARLLPLLARLARQGRIDVLDSHFGFPDGVAAAVLARYLRLPYFITLRGNETSHLPKPLMTSLFRWAFGGAARIITVSRPLAEFAIRLGVRPDRVKTIPNGVDSNLFFPRDRVQARLKHGLLQDSLVILSAGYLIERKGHHRIIQALLDLGRQGLYPELLIAGGPGREGLYEERIQKLVTTLGLQRQVRFLGKVEPSVMAELMSLSDVLCLASSREGWPNVVHEAMACGAPVVVTDVGGVAEMIPSEEYGYIVPVDAQEELVAALAKALRKPWRRDRITEWAQSRSWKQVAAEVAAEIREIRKNRA